MLVCGFAGDCFSLVIIARLGVPLVAVVFLICLFCLLRLWVVDDDVGWWFLTCCV